MWGEGRVVVRVCFGETCYDDEENDYDVDYGCNVVEARGALCAHDGEDADTDDDPNGDGVEVLVVLRPAVDGDSESIGVVLVAQGGEVGGPRTRNRRAAYDVFQEDVACCNVGHEVPKLHS